MIRLTGGEFRGRSIKTPSQGGKRGSGELTVRPTQARLRQALFNSLQAVVPGAKVLDLFAGSGALGFEALSRGAASVVFVEEDRDVIKLLEFNAAELGVKDRVEIIGDSVARAPKRLERHAPFDLVLADPPYAGGWELKLLNDFSWTELLAVDGIFCLEWGVQKSQVAELPELVPAPEIGPAQLFKVREKNYGDSVLTTYRRDGEEASASSQQSPSGETP